MAFILALLEGSAFFAAVAAMIFVWTRPIVTDWIDILALFGQIVSIALCCIIAFYYNDLYDLRIVRSFGGFAARLLQSFGVTLILLGIFYMLFPETKIAGGPFVSSLLIIFGLVLPLRATSYGLVRSGLLTRRVLVLGRSPLAHRIIAEIEAQPHLRYVVVGIVDDPAASPEPPANYPLLGPLDHLDKIIEEVRPDIILVALGEQRGRLPLTPLLEARTRRIVVAEGNAVYEHLAGKLALESLRPSNLIFSKDFCKSGLELALTRAASVLIAAVGLVATAPLFGLIALAIRLDSAGPILFVQDRVGFHGEHFKLLKFRTMHAAARTSEWVCDNTDRVTRLGKWLRKFRLDELPQFLNIIRGDMNLVGPRPHPVTNFDLFSEKIPYYFLRLAVRPGVTGWAQVRYGYANNLQEEIEKMRYDLYYIKHLSIRFDLRILFDTVKIVLFGRGSREADAYPAGARMESKS